MPGVLLFPGQGGYSAADLSALRTVSEDLDTTFAEIDEAVGGGLNVSGQLLRRQPPELSYLAHRAPDVLQFAIYGMSVAVHRILAALGAAPTLHLGHSLGEITALACAGAFSVRDGAQLVAARNEALRTVTDSHDEPGRMAALTCDRERAEGLLRIVGDNTTAIAAENGPLQTVISGRESAVAAACEAARDSRIRGIVLASPYAFHSPLLADAVPIFERLVERLQPTVTSTAVYSPIAGDFYQADDRLLTELATHLVRPVRFFSALRYVVELPGVAESAFIECGAGCMLTGVVRRALPGATCLVPLRERSSLCKALAMAAEALRW